MDGSLTDHMLHDEIRELRIQNATLREQNDALRRAIADWAQELANFTKAWRPRETP